jgi:hypothetical protein
MPSCRRFQDNTARLPLCALADNLANFLRLSALPRPARQWALTSLREKLIKIGAKVVAHDPNLTFPWAAVAAPRNLVAAILDWIGRLRVALASGCGPPRLTKWSERRPPCGHGAPDGPLATTEGPRGDGDGPATLRTRSGGEPGRKTVACGPPRGYSHSSESKSWPQKAPLLGKIG